MDTNSKAANWMVFHWLQVYSSNKVSIQLCVCNSTSQMIIRFIMIKMICASAREAITFLFIKHKILLAN